MAENPRVALETAGIRTGAEQAAPSEAFTAVRVATGIDLPGELRAMYEAWTGGAVGAMNVYDLLDVAEVNPDLREAIPFGLFFGDDGRDGAFFVDHDGVLGQKGAVYGTNRGTLVPADSVPVGDSLSDFLASAGRGERRWDGKSIRDRDIDELRASFEQHRDRWQSHGIPSPSQVMEALRAAKSMPREMHVLQRTAGSPRFPGVGVTVLPMAEMTAVEGAIDADGDPGAYWFATDEDGVRYAITAIGWRDPDGGRVLRVAPGEDPATAPIIGSMPRVVIDWLEGRAR
jgi:hypothetical protein